jgi:hypothetical protein
LEQALEEPGAALKEVKGSVSNAWGAIHQEQALRHEGGEALDAAVSLLIGGEVVVFERGGQGYGLTKTEGEAFAGDSVDRT